ncbi:MAG: hypothetical protein ACP5VF_08215 [Acidobacteriota bacterium]
MRGLLALLQRLFPSAIAGVEVQPRRKAAALAVAVFCDLAQIVFFPLFFEGAASPWDLMLDLVTAALLWGILGFRARLALGFVAELLPGFDLFPTWTALVMSLPTGSEGAQARPGSAAVRSAPQVHPPAARQAGEAAGPLPTPPGDGPADRGQ